MKLKRDRQKGQAILEMAIVFPLILLMLFGGIDVFLAVAAKQVVNYTAEETAACVSRNPSVCTDPQGYARQVGGGLGLNAPAIAVSVSSNSPKSNTVTLVYTWHPVSLFMKPITMTAVATATD